MAALSALSLTYSVSLFYRNLPRTTVDTLEKVDVDFHREYNPNDPKSLKKKGCGICFYKKIDSKVYVLLGQLQGKKGDEAKWNGTYATFAGKPKPEDFASGSTAINIMKRELREEFGSYLTDSELEGAFNKITTLFLLNAAYPHYKNPIFFVEATPKIAEAAEFFKPNAEIRRVRWIQAEVIIDSVKEVLQRYSELCTSFRVDHAEDLRKEWDQKRSEKGFPPFSDDEFAKYLEEYMRNEPRLQAARDGFVAGKTQGGMSVQVASYSARSILEMETAIQAMEKGLSMEEKVS